MSNEGVYSSRNNSPELYPKKANEIAPETLVIKQLNVLDLFFAVAVAAVVVFVVL